MERERTGENENAPRPASEPYSIDQGFQQRPGDNRFSEPKHRVVGGRPGEALEGGREKARDEGEPEGTEDRRRLEPELNPSRVERFRVRELMPPKKNPDLKDDPEWDRRGHFPTQKGSGTDLRAERDEKPLEQLDDESVEGYERGPKKQDAGKTNEKSGPEPSHR